MGIDKAQKTNDSLAVDKASEAYELYSRIVGYSAKQRQGIKLYLSHLKSQGILSSDSSVQVEEP